MQQNKNNRKRRKKAATPKICRFCEASVNYIDDLEPDLLKKFQTEKGRILPRRITGTCLIHQKMLSAAIKRARVLSLVY